MNVGKLKKLLETVADDTLVVVAEFDHSYRESEAGVTSAVVEKARGRRHLSEYYGPEYVTEGDKVITVVFIT